jgi:hypothetical protein
LRDIFCDRGYDVWRMERSFIKYEAKVSLPYLSESNEDNDMRSFCFHLYKLYVTIILFPWISIGRRKFKNIKHAQNAIFFLLTLIQFLMKEHCR